MVASTLSDSPIFSFTPANLTENIGVPNILHATNKQHKTLKSVRKLINSTNTNSGVSNLSDGGANREIISRVQFGSGILEKEPVNYRHSTPVRSKPVANNFNVNLNDFIVNKDDAAAAAAKFLTTSTSTVVTTVQTETTTKPTASLATVATSPPPEEEFLSERIISQYNTEKFRNYIEPNHTNFVKNDGKLYRNTVEVPPIDQLLYDPEDLPKTEPDQPPSYKLQPIPKLTAPPDVTAKTVADVPRNTTLPARISRVNTAIKSLIAVGTTRRPNTLCYNNNNNTPNNKCNNETKQRYLFLQ